MEGVLIFGDSIAFGRGESPNIGWAGRLKNYFEPKGFHHCVFNLAIPGETTTTLLQRFETEIKARIKYIHPGDKFIILLSIGVNDSKGIGSINKLETSPKQFEKNTSKLIKISKKYTKNIVIIGLIPVNEKITNPFEDTYFTNKRIQEYNGILKKFAKRNKITYINLFDSFIKLNLSKYLVDGLHPNKKGYEKMYRIIKDSLVKGRLI